MEKNGVEIKHNNNNNSKGVNDIYENKEEEGKELELNKDEDNKKHPLNKNTSLFMKRAEGADDLDELSLNPVKKVNNLFLIY